MMMGVVHSIGFGMARTIARHVHVLILRKKTQPQQS